MHWDGAAWTRVGLPAGSYGPDVNAVWTPASGDLWLGTRRGLYRRMGTTWTVLDDDLYVEKIGGSSPDDVWISTGNAQLVHYGSDGPSLEQTGAGQPIEALWVGDGDVWVAGASGGILHRR